MGNEYIYLRKIQLKHRDIIQLIVNVIFIVLVVVTGVKIIAAGVVAFFHMDGFNIASRLAYLLFRIVDYASFCGIVWEIVKALDLSFENVRANFSKTRHVLATVLNIIIYIEEKNLVTDQVPDAMWTAIAFGVLSWGDFLAWLVTIFLICGLIGGISYLIFNPKKMLNLNEEGEVDIDIFLPLKRILNAISEKM